MSIMHTNPPPLGVKPDPPPSPPPVPAQRVDLFLQLEKLGETTQRIKDERDELRQILKDLLDIRSQAFCGVIGAKREEQLSTPIWRRAEEIFEP